jgi:hypothetical protein
MEGIYRFYLGNELVYEQKNALTVAGRSIIIKSLLGIIPNFANSIAYGIGNKENTFSASVQLITNNTLQFETGATKVLGSSISLENGNDILIYSGTINDPFQSEIREVGLYPSPLADATIGLNGSLIFDFDRVDNFIKYGTASAAGLISTENARIGTELFNLPQTSSANNYIQYAATDGTISYIDKYTSQDIFRLAGYNSNTSSGTVFFRFFSDISNYYDLRFITPTSSGYFIIESQKGSVDITGTPSWNTISFVRIWQDNTLPVLLDGMRLEVGEYAVDTNYGLISRAVLPSAIKKPASIPLTIEYSLALGFNYGVS